MLHTQSYPSSLWLFYLFSQDSEDTILLFLLCSTERLHSRRHSDYFDTPGKQPHLILITSIPITSITSEKKTFVSTAKPIQKKIFCSYKLILAMMTFLTFLTTPNLQTFLCDFGHSYAPLFKLKKAYKDLFPLITVLIFTMFELYFHGFDWLTLLPRLNITTWSSTEKTYVFFSKAECRVHGYV